MKKFSLLILFISFLLNNAYCSLSTERAGGESLHLPAIFGDGMVFQRNAPIPVWGWGSPGEKVKVTFAGKTKTATVAKDGTWKVTFPAMPAGGPYELCAISGDKTIKITSPSGRKGGASVGDVFLFSGQSNQELPIRRCMDNNSVAAIATTYTNDNVHILKLPQQFNFTDAQDDCRGADWVTINPQTAPNIAALSYFIGKELQESAGVPIGIINSSVGGTRVEAWMSRENLQQFPEYEKILAHQKFHQKNWADSIRTIEGVKGAAWDKELAAGDTVLNKWNKPGYDFSSWQAVNIFDEWYSKEQPNGSYWFRNTFTINSLPTGRAGEGLVLLRLGAMKDADEVYVNGQKVGNTTYQYPPRKYEFPASLLREGENEIMIHLTSQGGTPNFTPQKFYQLEYGNRAILLDKGWTMAIGKLMPHRPYSTYFVDTPVGLYNAMISPLGNLAIRGMVWYQGEANVGNPYHYKEYLQAMIDEWHTQFPTPVMNSAKSDKGAKGAKSVKSDKGVKSAKGDKGVKSAKGDKGVKGVKGAKVSKAQEPWPSVIVQLASYMDHHKGTYNSGWCDVRDQQYQATVKDPYSRLRTPDCYLATAIDCGEWNDIHPQDKQTISHRVALQLRKNVYGEDIISEGPRPVSCQKNGDQLVVKFSPETGKLRPIHDGIAKVTGNYELTINIPAATKAASSTYTIVEDKNTNASVFRYAHDDYPYCTIYNTEGIPSPQFSIEIK